MSRPRMAPAAAALLAALGLAAPAARAQSPAAGSPAVTDSGLPDPMASARTARHLMRNGQDYLSYKQYERALSYLRQAEARQAELTTPERVALRRAIDRARQGMREPEPIPDTSLARARGTRDRDREPQTAGTFALARPIRGPEAEPIQLASAVIVAPKGPAAPPAPVVAADLPTSPVPSALPELPGTAEPVAPPPPLGSTPTPAPEPVPAPEPASALPALPPVAAPIAAEPPAAVEPPEAAIPVLAAQPEDSLPELPAVPAAAAAAAEVIPAETADAAPVAAEPAPAPAEVEVSAPPADPSTDNTPAAPAPGLEGLAAPTDPIVPASAEPAPAEAALPPPPEDASPLAASPAAPPELPPQAPAEVAPSAKDAPGIAGAPGRVSTLSPETLRQVEEVARRQEAESRRATDAAPTARAEQPIGVGADSQTNRLELPRAPSPTEARPIRPIPIPEETLPMTPRRWEPTSKFWASVGSCHTPLYFQDAVLERYGQSVEQGMGPFGRFATYRLDDPTQSNQRMQIAQPFVSLALFYGQVVALPYNLIVDPPWEAEYDLGYYRPGDRIPPDSYYLPWLGVGPPFKGRNYGGFHGHR